MPRRHLARLSAVLFVISIVLSSLAAVSVKSAASLDTEAQRTLIRNASLVLTMDPAVGVGPLGALEQADVLLDGDRIVAVGKDLDEHNATVIDASGRIVMPGFVARITTSGSPSSAAAEPART
jgi:5-methylthioadenosine/S-adenosylhomocysteine deaminase